MIGRALLLAGGLVLAGCGGSGKETVASSPTSPAPTFSEATSPSPTFASTTSTTPADVPSGTTESNVPPAAPSSSAPPPAAPSGDLAAQLDQLIVAPEGSSDGYDRSLFGGGWIDADSDGCDTRCEVLEEERLNELPGLPMGGWLSIFDGYSTDDASELDIDHVVALGEAWRSGADQWDGRRRLAFANDLDDPDPLIAVTASTNRSKSDRDPASWQPPNLDAWCPFAAAWIDTKVRWGLTADDAEVRALRNMIESRSGC